jgi:hypothetical protein
MERAGNGASGKRCDIDGMTRTGELAGVSESSRDIDHRTRGARVRERDAIESKLMLAKTFGVRSLDATPIFPTELTPAANLSRFVD